MEPEKYILMRRIIDSGLYRWVTILSALISIIAGVWVAYEGMTYLKHTDEPFAKITGTCQEQSLDSATLEKLVKEIQRNLAVTLSQKSDKDSGDGMEWKLAIVPIVQQVNQLSERIEGLEGALLNTPTKALAVPLLRKEFESLEKMVAISRAEVDRLYSMLFWVASILVTIALGTIGLVFSNRK